MKKVFSLFSVILLMLLLSGLVGCEETNKYEGQVKIIFNLEGGKYHESGLSFINYYKYEEGEPHYIFDPQELSNKPVTRESYSFGGWYRTKTEVDGKVIYSDPWNFETDEVTTDELNLYAKWNRFTYVVGYKDENNNFIETGTYYVDEGEKFRDIKKFTNRNGYTLIDYEDEDGNPFDISTFVHPGDAKERIVIVCKYIKGIYKIVNNLSDLKKSKDSNIYLNADIDMNGESFDFGDYSKNFIGNGHTISNVVINYSAQKNDLKPDFVDKNENSLMISLFGQMKNATIQDVNFENVSVEIKTKYSNTYKVYFSPIALALTNSSIKNVSFKGTFTVTELPDKMDMNTDVLIFKQKYEDFVKILDPETKTIIIKNEVYFEKDESSVVDNVTIELTLK